MLGGLIPRRSLGDTVAVKLTEVVRSTKRIVAGSAMFQVTAGRKAETTSASASVGPPLEAVLFDAADARGATVDLYASRVAKAVEGLAATYRGLSLHDRVAIVVPDEDFADALRQRLAAWKELIVERRDVEA